MTCYFIFVWYVFSMDYYIGEDHVIVMGGGQVVVGSSEGFLNNKIVHPY